MASSGHQLLGDWARCGKGKTKCPAALRCQGVEREIVRFTALNLSYQFTTQYFHILPYTLSPPPAQRTTLCLVSKLNSLRRVLFILQNNKMRISDLPLCKIE